MNIPVTGGASVNPEHADFAKQMRRAPTPSEAKAWELLRNRRCLGLKFRRQQVILGFIVDFYCADERLAVELDGSIHDRQAGYDAARDEALGLAGIRVVRLRNEELNQETLERAVAVRLTSPPGPLSMNGEGEPNQSRSAISPMKTDGPQPR